MDIGNELLRAGITGLYGSGSENMGYLTLNTGILGSSIDVEGLDISFIENGTGMQPCVSNTTLMPFEVQWVVFWTRVGEDVEATSKLPQ